MESSDSIFMIRSGDFGENFGRKLILTIIGFLLCVYDWRTSKNRRKDYFYVWICGAIAWSLAETLLHRTGTRIYKKKDIFGLDVSNAFWLTIPLQGMSEGAAVTISGIFFGDRIRRSKKWLVVFFLFWLSFIPIYAGKGINYDNVNVGDPDISSRRDMFPILANIWIFCSCSIAFIWYFLSAPSERTRGLLMYLVMASWIGWWTLCEWVTGQRWIEVGTINYEDGTFSNLRRASPLVEFGALAYDYAVEVSLIYIPFLAIPYWLGLIKPLKQKRED